MFEINFAEGTAEEWTFTDRGNVRINNYKLFVSPNGLYISTRKGIKVLKENEIKIV